MTALPFARAREWLPGAPAGLVALALLVGAGAGGGAVWFAVLIPIVGGLLPEDPKEAAS